VCLPTISNMHISTVTCATAALASAIVAPFSITDSPQASDGYRMTTPID
jgi:hypothetical protein